MNLRSGVAPFRALLLKEVRAALFRPSTFLIAGMILFVQGVLFYYYVSNLGSEYSAVLLETFFEISTPMTIFGTVLISIRSLSDEYKQGSVRLLQSSPVSDFAIVISKAMALWGVCGLMTMASAYLPLYIYSKGQVSIGHIFVGYLGLYLVSMATVSLSLWCSSLTDKQFLAGALLGVIISISYLGHRFSGLFGSTIGKILKALSFKSHLRTQYGLIVGTDVAYYIAIVFLFLCFASFSLYQKRLRS